MTGERLRYLCDRLQEFGGASVFAEMSALAVRTGAINLGQGFPDTSGPAAVAEAAIEAIRGDFNQYPPGIGYPVLRQAVAEHQKRFWGLEFDPDTEVLITAGATEAITAAILALAGPGDEVVTFEPYFDIYPADISMAGAERRLVRLRPPSYTFDPDELAAAFGPRTRVLVLNSPHNPTGKVFSVEELDIIARLCVEHDVVAVTDEVYEHLIFDQNAHVPLASRPGMADRTVTISSGGKTLSFTGWKIGWVCARPELVRAVQAAKQLPHLRQRRAVPARGGGRAAPRRRVLRRAGRRPAGPPRPAVRGPGRSRLRAGRAPGHLLHHRRHPSPRCHRRAGFLSLAA